MSKKITMQQIADYLGVSKFVVSKALSGKGGVSGTTKERVIQAASQLGYFSQNNAYVRGNQPDAAPAAAAKQTVLVLMPNIRFQTKESLYWGRILDGISARLEEKGYGMLIISEQSIDQIANVLNPKGITGLIGVGEISTALLLEVHRIGLPMVLVDHEDPLIPTDTVFVNNYDCMYRLTKHLIGIGHREISFLGGVRYSRSFLDRWTGFRSALEECGHFDPGAHLTELTGFTDFGAQIAAWLQAMKKRKNQPLPTAVVCANDTIALDAIAAFREAGLSVPDELSVTGFDNIEDAYRMRPALTTVHVPKEALGRRAVDKLFERSARSLDPLEKILVAGELLFRDSIMEVKGHKHA